MLYGLPIKTYVVHAKTGYEFHGQRVVDLFKKHNIPFEFVTEGTPESITPGIQEKYFTEAFVNHVRPGSLSCTLNHLFAMEKFLASEEEYGLFFEDDPCFLGSFQKGIEKLFPHIQQLEKGFIVSLENTSLTFPSYWQTRKNKLLYRAKRGRMAGAYLMDKEAVQKAMDYCYQFKCGFLPDWFHNELIEKKIVKMYWAQPPIVEQGSHNGILSSSISSKAKSNKRIVQWKIRRFFKTVIGRLFNQKRILE